MVKNKTKSIILISKESWEKYGCVISRDRDAQEIWQIFTK